MTVSSTSNLDPNEAAAAASSADKTAPASCPLNDDYLQLIPVRYAYVENLAGNANDFNRSGVDWAQAKAEPSQGASDINQAVAAPHPVGYRFIRDGWLYIVDDTARRIYEYVLKDGVVTERTYKGLTVGNFYRDSYDDIRQENDKPLKLVFKKDRKLYISYSQVQWTDAKCKQVSNRAERKLLMQEIDLTNVSCEHISPHLLTREQAESAIAEVAEVYQPPAQTTEFDTECTAYSWTVTPFDRAGIGRLTGQLNQKYEQKGNYLFVAVYDDVAMMLDLENEQQLVSKWLNDWAKKDDNDLKYNIGSYIDSTLTITSTNAAQKGAGPWVSSLPIEQQDAIYDYVNEKVALDQVIAKNVAEKKAAGWSAYQVDNDILNEYSQRYAVVAAKRQRMIDLIGQPEVDAHKTEIDALHENQWQHYNGDIWGARGVNQLVDVEGMQAYLTLNREKYNRWQKRLDVITNARCLLYTNYYHRASWYYDNASDEQFKAVLQLEKKVLQDIQRNDESIALLAAFLDSRPYHVFPAVQTNFTFEYLTTTLPEVIKWFDESSNVVQAMISPPEAQGTPIQQLEKLMGKTYWHQLLNASGDIGELQKLHYLNLSPAINQSLAGFIMEATRPLLGERGQANFNNALADYEKMVTQMGLGARASFLLEIRRVGHVYISDTPGVNAATNKALNDINKNLNKIQDNNLQLAKKINERDRLRDPASAESRRLEKGTLKQTRQAQEKAYKKLTKEIETLQKETATRHSKVEDIQQRLAKYISPLKEGEVAASLRFNRPAELQASLEYEKGALTAGVAKAYGQGKTGFVTAAKSAGLPTVLLAFSAFNLGRELDKFNEQLAEGKRVGWVPFIAAISGTVAASSSVWLAAHSALLNKAIEATASMPGNITGAHLSGRLGRINILLGSVGQIFGGLANYINLITTFSKWRDALLSGDSGKAAAAALALTGNIGNAGVSTYGFYHTISVGRQVYRDLKAGKQAAHVIWSVRGAQYATALGRVTPIGLAFTALYLVGEYAYNYFNLSEIQDWFYRSCWGKDNRQWDRAEHHHQLAEALLKPVIVDRGVTVIDGQHYRVIRAVFPGQLTGSLIDKPLEWQAQWKFKRFERPENIDITPGEMLRQHTVLLDDNVVALEWRLPWLSQQEWSLSMVRELHLRLFYTPDMTEQPLGGANGLGYKIPLYDWSDGQNNVIKQLPGDKISIDVSQPLISYQGGYYGQ